MSSLHDYSISRITVIVQTNGVVSTVTQDGIQINELSGDLTILHKLLPIIYDKSYRRDWFKDKYNITILVYVNCVIAIVNTDGVIEQYVNFNQDQLIKFTSFIKKK